MWNTVSLFSSTLFDVLASLLRLIYSGSLLNLYTGDNLSGYIHRTNMHRAIPYTKICGDCQVL